MNEQGQLDFEGKVIHPAVRKIWVDGYEREAPTKREPPNVSEPKGRRLTRTTSPETSLIAIEKLIASGGHLTTRALALKLVREHPGLTAPELAEKGGVTRYVIGPRLTELMQDYRVVYQGDRRVPPGSNTSMVTWYPA